MTLLKVLLLRRLKKVSTFLMQCIYDVSVCVMPFTVAVFKGEEVKDPKISFMWADHNEIIIYACINESINRQFVTKYM